MGTRIEIIKTLPPGPTPDPWIRPSDWLALPTVLDTDDTFVALHAVIEDGDNFVAFTFTTDLFSGNYDVDWGDGTFTNHASGTIAEHTYNFNTYDPGNTTLSTRGYKQAIIQVTPSIGNFLATANFQVRRITNPVQNQQYSTGFLDCILSMPNAGNGASITFGGFTVRHSYCEQFEIKNSGGCTNFSSLFNLCRALQSVILSDTSNVTTTFNMFQNCTSLRNAPMFNTANVTSMNGMFASCTALVVVPLYNTSNVVIMTSMFGSCTALTAVPLFDTSSVTTINQMFNGCSSLKSIPLFNTANVSNISLMFTNCFTLESVPLFNTANVTNMQQMLDNCRSLKSVPLFNTVNVTNMQQLFDGCSALQNVPLFNTSNVTNMGGMFSNCSSLRTIPTFNTTNVTSMNSMFSNCFSLQSIPLLNTGNVTNMGFMFSSANSLNAIPALSTAAITPTIGLDFTGFASNALSLNSCKMEFARAVSFSTCQLSQTAIEEIFTNLKNRGATTIATISVSGNWGVGPTFSRTSATTTGSNVITTNNTASLEPGMQVTGIGAPVTSAIAVTITDSTDTINLNDHGLQDGDEVSFATITTTTGIIINTVYYVINSTQNDFQLSTTISGSPINLVNDGSGTLRYKTEIVSIVPNVSITMSRPMTVTSASTSLTFRSLRTDIAILKGWSVTG